MCVTLNKQGRLDTVLMVCKISTVSVQATLFFNLIIMYTLY